MSAANNNQPDDVIAELDALLGDSDKEFEQAQEAVKEIRRPNLSTTAFQESDPAPVVPIRRGKRRILVVEDNKDYRDVLSFVLAEQGYEVRLAENGMAGMRLAHELHPDIIILDFNMPELNGYEMLQEVRRSDELRKIPVIMFTGARNRRQLKEMGLDVQEFLEKPVRNAKLISSVEKLIGRAKDPSPSSEPIESSPAAETDQTVTQIIERTRPGVLHAPPPAPVGFVGHENEENEEESSISLDGIPLGGNSEADEQAQFNGRIELPPVGKREEVQEEEPKSSVEIPELADLEVEESAIDDLTNYDDLVDFENEDKGKDDEEVAGLEAMANDSPLVKRVNSIIAKAAEMNASDIHIEPQETEIVVRVRVNGSLQKLCELPLVLGTRLSARVKIMADLIITERRRPQDGQFRATILGRKIEFRVSTLPSTYGEKIVMRILGGNKLNANLDDIGMCDRDAFAVEKALETPNGLILVTGPTGSGKTTTLYSMIAAINKPDVNVMTAEDPVEYRLPGITQTNVKPEIGLTFESVLRSFLRQDPDVMLVGEVRDLETAEIAVKASITGHLVLSTLHTNSAPATISRLTHMGLAPYLVSGSVRLIVAQRLVKTLCESCKMKVPISKDEAKFLSKEEVDRLSTVYRSAGCKECRQTGYTGRLPVFEVMEVRSAEMRAKILEGASADELMAQAVSEGMIPLREAALNVVANGETSIAEAMKIILGG